MPSEKRQIYTRTCMACGKDHTTHKPKAKRCRPCIDAGRKAKPATCPACDILFPKVDGESFCRSCRTLSPLDTAEMLFEKTLEQEAEDRRILNQARRKRAVELQLEKLEKLGNKPRGYPNMTKETARSAIGVLWLNLCATEGAVNCLLNDREVDDETKNRILTTFLRLRLKGFTTEAISKIDPAPLMAKDAAEVDETIRGLPKVEKAEEDDDRTFDPFEGLDERMHDEIIAFEERQKQREMELRLGLAP